MPRLECATEIDERSPRTGKLFRQACGLAKTKSDVRPESVMTAERLVRGLGSCRCVFLAHQWLLPAFLARRTMFHIRNKSTKT